MDMFYLSFESHGPEGDKIKELSGDTAAWRQHIVDQLQITNGFSNLSDFENIQNLINCIISGIARCYYPESIFITHKMAFQHFEKLWLFQTGYHDVSLNNSIALSLREKGFCVESKDVPRLFTAICSGLRMATPELMTHPLSDLHPQTFEGMIFQILNSPIH